jgi:hypothetical protein
MIPSKFITNLFSHMKRNYFLFLLLFFSSISKSFSQKIASLEVDLSTTAAGMTIPASIELDKLTYYSDSSLSLFEVEGTKRTAVPFQISQGEQRLLNWLVKPGTGSSARKKVFELHKGTPSKFDQVTATVKDGALTISSGNKNLLRYWFKTVYPPDGVDTAFKRSAFIHPLWTPNGQELTRIQAPDHYHHYGIWNPWTHVLFEGDTVDFWNIKGRQGTVRFGNFVAVNNGPVYSEFKAVHEHVAFKNRKGGEKVALNELQTVRVYKPEAGQDYYNVDITIDLNCASESPVRILEYRYAGLGWRATAKWNKDNSEVITSEGKNRAQSDGTNGRWFIVQGALDNDYGGAVMMSYPANYNHPEPMRIWPENSNTVGEMFAMFAPTKNKDWLLNPGQTYTLKYRFVVFNGKFNKEKAEAAWQYYAMPPKVTVRK